MSKKNNNPILTLRDTPSKLGKYIREYDGHARAEALGAGDSFYLPGFLDEAEAPAMLRALLREVDFVQMFNVSARTDLVAPIPRLVSAQAAVSAESAPIYRMPGCNESNIETTQWTQTTLEVVSRASAALGVEFNHCVHTLYRDQRDSLGLHRDKLVDLADAAPILSVSLGAARPIVFEEVGGRSRHTILLQPGSLLAIGPRTNLSFVHGIPKLRGPCGPRISLSIRRSATFVDQATERVVGKGDAYQTRHYPFIRSYADHSTYSEAARRTIARRTAEARAQLERLRS
ncbi:MAG: alpha-ketoglutarate-dependent dioxygenase AlkB [Nannocystaceae bacterium]